MKKSSVGAALRRRLGERFVDGEVVRRALALDASRIPPAAVPLGVVRPRDARDVAAAVRICADHGTAIFPRGGASGLTGGSLVSRPGVVMDFAPLNRILRLSPEDRTVSVQAGVLTGRLHEALERLGFLYPPDPASAAFCTVGGNLSENAGGLRALKYGTTRDYLLAATVVTADGEILRLGSDAHKSVAGYDLLRLLVGSEGTLAIFVDATLRFLPAPKAVATLSAVFADEQAALEAALGLLKEGLLPRALEFVDGVCAGAVGAASGPFLIVEFDGHPAEVRAAAAEARSTLKKRDAVRVSLARAPARREALWEARRRVSTALLKISPTKAAEDVCVPLSQLPALYRALRRIGRACGVETCAYGHVGDGNLHVNLLPRPRRRTDGAVARLMKAALELRGTITGEHGVGVSKKRYLPLETGAAVLSLMRRVKRLFDPRGVLNPGKIF